MSVPLLTNPYYAELADEHRQWLSAFHSQHTTDWNNLLGNNVEAALCEAVVRQGLQRNGIAVEPNASLTGSQRQPDFKCSTPTGQVFYVEVACISETNAADKTGIQDGTPGIQAFDPAGIARAVNAKCREKASQCANLSDPCLIAIGTFHSMAAMVGFKKLAANFILTGRAQLTWTIDTGTGSQVGDTRNTTTLQDAAFLAPDASSIGFARSSISGLLLASASLEAPWLGLLHPNPVRPFDPSWLADIEFGKVAVDQATNQLQTVWRN